jgi:flagellar protein FliS
MKSTNSSAASAYRSVGVQTQASTSHDQYNLVLLMLEGVIESTNMARGAIAQNDLATKITKINKSIRILQEGLRTSLDLDHGGELAANLANLYDYCVMRLTQANASNNPDMLEEVVNLLKPVADAWKQMRAGAAAGNEAAPSAAEPKATPVMPTKAPHVARRVGSAYGQNMAWAGA